MTIPSSAPKRIDAHHHLWRYRAAEFPWIGPDMGVLRRNFLLSDLAPSLAAAGVDGSVVVQARQTIPETEWLLAVARETPTLFGVVGWLPIADMDFPQILDRFASAPCLKGLRHVVQGELPGFLDRAAFNKGIGEITKRGLVYDLLITWEQLEESLRFIDRHPNQSFVIDHVAKPDIRSGVFDAWAVPICEIARRPNVTCKISGMLTEADWHTWTAAELEPYFTTVLESFGADRLMVGTDWPVLTVACEYQRWWDTVDLWVNPLSTGERASILAGTAARIYSLLQSPGPGDL